MALPRRRATRGRVGGRPLSRPSCRPPGSRRGPAFPGLLACLVPAAFLAIACPQRSVPAKHPASERPPARATPSPDEDCDRARSHFARAARSPEPEEEIYFLRMGLRICPSDARAHADLGAAYAGLGRRDEARAELEEAIDLDPDLVEARNALDALGKE